jgi:hypothetical protein
MALTDADLRWLDARFNALDDAIQMRHASVTGQIAGLETRTAALESSRRQLLVGGGGLGAFAGAVVAAVLGYFGVRPQ